MKDVKMTNTQKFKGYFTGLRQNGKLIFAVPVQHKTPNIVDSEIDTIYTGE